MILYANTSFNPNIKHIHIFGQFGTMDSIEEYVNKYNAKADELLEQYKELCIKIKDNVHKKVSEYIPLINELSEFIADNSNWFFNDDCDNYVVFKFPTDRIELWKSVNVNDIPISPDISTKTVYLDI